MTSIISVLGIPIKFAILGVIVDNLLSMKVSVPKHIAIIMDGNRRWAANHNLPELEGHRQGLDTLVKISEEAKKMGIEYLTVYALSTENFQRRGGDEISGLLALVNEAAKKYLPRLKKAGVRLNVFGDLESLPLLTRSAIKQVENELRFGKNGVLSVALNYGARSEILRAAAKVAASKGEFTEEEFAKELYSKDIPDPDLLIRTGGMKRLSNFLLWQLSYSEIYFTDTLWPDFDKRQLGKAVEFFRKSRRNFGR